MKNKNIIFHELKGISPLIAQISKANLYSVPSSYFNNLSADLAERLKLSKEGFNDLSTIMPYTVPTGYFENFSERLSVEIYSEKQSAEVFEETALIAPLLNTISKNPVYNIPDGFFAEPEIPNKEVKKHTAKVVSVNRAKVFRFSAAAAAVILFFTAGLYTITKKSDTALSAPDTAKNKVKNLSKEEIVHFLKSNISSQNVTSASNPKLKNEAAIKSSLKEVSDKEIQQFLTETGESDEI